MSNDEDILLIDFDGTLTNCIDNILYFNLDLMDEIKLKKINNPKLILIGFTSFLLKFNLKKNVELRNTRKQIIDFFVERTGYNFDYIIVTASPFAEKIIYKNEKYEFGEYYIKVIMPIEIKAIELYKNDPDQLTGFTKLNENLEEPYLSLECQETKDARLELLKEYHTLEDENFYKNGKEEMFIYVINHFGKDKKYFLYDDKAEVLETMKALSEKFDIEGERIVFRPQVIESKQKPGCIYM